MEELTKHEKALLNDLFRSWNHATKHVKEIFIDRICEAYDRQGDPRSTSKVHKTTGAKDKPVRRTTRSSATRRPTGEDVAKHKKAAK